MAVPTLEAPLEESKGCSALSAMSPGALLAYACMCLLFVALAHEDNDFKSVLLLRRQDDRMFRKNYRVLGARQGL